MPLFSKSKSSKAAPFNDFLIPNAPFLYICDPTEDAAVASKLCQLIPKTLHMTFDSSPQRSIQALSQLKNGLYDHETVFVFTYTKHEHNEGSKKKAATFFREAAIECGTNFASINLCFDEDTNPTSWGANHLNVQMKGQSEYVINSEIDAQADKIYKWLFTVLSVKETLHLIPDEQMREIDAATSFPDSEYCTISNCHNIPKDAKIQFVALIVSKPTIVSENRLTWQVADKTGVANFFFKWRGPSSQSTWEWVLALQPGQRKCLPRMPCVLVKEKLLTTVVKAPIRIPGSLIHTSGRALRSVGRGLSRVGRHMKKGKRQQWVPEEDVAEYLKSHRNFKLVPTNTKTAIKVFTEKGGKTWSDKDSTRSTLWNEKAASEAKEDTV